MERMEQHSPQAGLPAPRATLTSPVRLQQHSCPAAPLQRQEKVVSSSKSTFWINTDIQLDLVAIILFLFL